MPGEIVGAVTGNAATALFPQFPFDDGDNLSPSRTGAIADFLRPNGQKLQSIRRAIGLWLAKDRQPRIAGRRLVSI